MVCLALCGFSLGFLGFLHLFGWSGMMQLRQAVVASVFLLGVRGSAWYASLR